MQSGTAGAKQSLRRLFSENGRHPFDCITWTKRTAEIRNIDGEVIFSQNDVEVPSAWSQMATDVVASKYFRKTIDHGTFEVSVKQVISRVSDSISEWGGNNNYFSNSGQKQIFNDELCALLVSQYCAFNSPVWFNVGVEEHPQCSACFILSVEDSLDDLLELQKLEAKLFKHGSGSGTNLSSIRSTHETLSGGGTPSGPISFMRGFDAWAASIKSGGKTRRAAKMQILNCDHGDIETFVSIKRLEEEKAQALIRQGYSAGFNVPGGAYDSVFFQNSNLSVRASDEFMQAVVDGRTFKTRSLRGETIAELDASDLLREIAYGTWACGDPGLQFDTTINDWHTCPNSGRINSSNPCSEYMHIDNSACNLASLNLVKFLDAEGNFDLNSFCAAISILIRAQDIIVDSASYPTEVIARNASAFRQIGLGYSNLGALLMSKGLAYDSDEGRSLAATITAIMSAQAYLTSALLAKELGAFSEYAKNRSEMLRVIAKHKNAADCLTLNSESEKLTVEARNLWAQVLDYGERYGFRNSQTTALAPTGTISFMMDCDTTGIEPELALVKYKKLEGGGFLKIVNSSVTSALRNLGYNSREISGILAHLEKNDTIEGAPDLNVEHLPVFDCAFKAGNGRRSISCDGHLNMMASTQPFISGAISKTINFPEETNAEDIFHAYIKSWKLGLKAVAMYRDNSRQSQPLGTELDDLSDISLSEQRQEPKTISLSRIPKCETCGVLLTVRQGACRLCANCGSQGACG
jgi:ribonucleoside-diphosphate reductase alpha chain